MKSNPFRVSLKSLPTGCCKDLKREPKWDRCAKTTWDAGIWFVTCKINSVFSHMKT